jgi:hypothetical protein
LEGARWSAEGGNQYAVTWPQFADTITIAADGRSLSGSNNYFASTPIISGQRISGGLGGFAGSWRWSTGFVVVADPAGGVVSGPFQGSWSSLGGAKYRIDWTHFPVDKIVVSAGGQSLTGQIQYGATVAGTRTPGTN